MQNINMPDLAPCSGCGGCAAVCPKGAVHIQLNEKGFYQACVREELCVDCGLCLKVCHRFHEPEKGVSLYDAKLYALQSAEAKTVQKCSSGGIAHELAVQALENGGKAVGAVYDLTGNTVRHEIVSDLDQIPGLDGSKYLQSDPGNAFRTILEEAKQTSFAVFGTPCQIAALAAASELRGVRQNLLLVEIFCHGVPSYLVWEETLKKVKKKLGTEQFEDVQFRYKKDDWHSYCLKITGNGKTHYGKRETELFWQVFFENILLGDACQVCQARRAESHADLRLGDYWGSHFQHRSDGVSAVFACTRRGRDAVEKLLSEGRAVELAASDAAQMLAAQNMQGYHHQQLHSEAMEVLRTRGVKAAVSCYRKKQNGKQKLKRVLLRASALIPDPLRAKLRKANSSRLLRKS